MIYQIEKEFEYDYYDIKEENRSEDIKHKYNSFKNLFKYHGSNTILSETLYGMDKFSYFFDIPIIYMEKYNEDIYNKLLKIK